MQLSRDDLLKAYTRMRMIREFEDAVHVEFSAGNIPGFVHLYAGEEASGVGVCMHLEDRDGIASTHRGHGHCIAKGCDEQAMMAGDLRQEGRSLRRQGRLDAHRRPVQGHAGRQRHRRRRPAADLRRRARRQDPEDGRRRHRLRRRWRFQPGHDVRNPDNLAKVWNLPAIFVVEDNGYAESTASKWSVGGSQVRHAATDSALPSMEVDGSISSPSTRPRAR